MANTRPIIIASAGIAVPRDRVDYYRWQAQARQSFRVEYTGGDAEPFFLHSQVEICFRHLLYRLGADSAFIIDEIRYVAHTQAVSFEQSDLYAQLSDRARERLDDILARIVKGSARIALLETELSSLKAVLGEHPASNARIDDLNRELRKRQRILRKRDEELKSFADAKSTSLTEMIDIGEIRLTPWWNTEIDDFFEALIDEAYDDNEMQRQEIRRRRPALNLADTLKTASAVINLPDSSEADADDMVEDGDAPPWKTTG